MKLAFIPEEETMREFGFTDHVETSWYFVERIYDDYPVSFNLKIDKDDYSYDTYVLDENFGQPEYYMEAKEEYKNLIIQNIDDIVQKMHAIGLNIVHDHNQYYMR